jgi:hypothetical protein
MAIDFPNSPVFQTYPVQKDQYIATNGSLYFYDNSTSWTTLGDTQSGVNPYTNSFRYRTIYTRGYIAAGYKNSSPWSNVNRTIHSTDVTNNLGDILDRSAGYIDGGWSDYYAYTYNMTNTLNTGSAGTYTSSYNMQTEVGRSHSSSWDSTNRYEPSALLTANLSICYLSGGGSYVTDKHNYTTETMTLSGAPNNPGVGGATQSTSFSGEFRGWLISSSAACYMQFATESWTNGGMTTSSDGHSKMLGSKHGYGWGKSAGNTGTTGITKWSDTTGTSYGVVCYTPNSSGEENFQIGQNQGYCLGHYNGAQNNETYKINYLTDALTSLGSDCQPKGHDGMSSAAPASAAASVLGGY